MRSRLAVAALLATLVACGGSGDVEPRADETDLAGRPWGALGEMCGDDTSCGCIERCVLSGKYLTCGTGPVRPNGEGCTVSLASGTCVNASCCLVACPEDTLACTKASCAADPYTCAQVVDCPPKPCFSAGACDGSGNCTWSAAYLGDGASCGADFWCYQQLCRPGCFIAGQYYDPGAARPLNPCQVCSPLLSHVDWTDLPDGGGCGAGKVCAGGGCLDGCLIGGTLRALGMRNPANECQACTADHPDHWADTTDFCTDDGDPCTIDRCAAGACTHPRNPAACRPQGTDSMFGCASGDGAGGLALSVLALALGRATRRRRAGLLAALALSTAAPTLASAAPPKAPPARAAPAKAAPPVADAPPPPATRSTPSPRASRVDPDAVAIVRLTTGAGVSGETARFVTQALGAELHARGLSTVSQEDVRAALGFEKERETLGCDSAGCFAELGGTLGVRRLVTGSLARIGESLVFDLQLVDMSAGGAVRRHAVRRPASRGDDAFLEAIPELVEALFPPDPGTAPRGPFAIAVGGWAELDSDLGGAGLLLLRWSFAPSLRASGGLIAAPHRLGALASLGWIPWNAEGKLYPFASLALLLLAADPVSPGVGLSAGVEWRVTPRIDVALEARLVRLFAVLDGMRETYPFAAVTAAWRL